MVSDVRIRTGRPRQRRQSQVEQFNSVGEAAARHDPAGDDHDGPVVGQPAGDAVSRAGHFRQGAPLPAGDVQAVGAVAERAAEDHHGVGVDGQLAVALDSLGHVVEAAAVGEVKSVGRGLDGGQGHP